MGLIYPPRSGSSCALTGEQLIHSNKKNNKTLDNYKEWPESDLDV